MINLLSMDEKQKRLEKMGRNSYEYEQCVKRCWKAIKDQEIKEQEMEREKQLVKKHSTIKLFKE